MIDRNLKCVVRLQVMITGRYQSTFDIGWAVTGTDPDAAYSKAKQQSRLHLANEFFSLS